VGIPIKQCTDWKIYEEIIYHLMQNAVKFNLIKGCILIEVSFCTLKLPLDFENQIPQKKKIKPSS
jgi:hypothetical protein